MFFFLLLFVYNFSILYLIFTWPRQCCLIKSLPYRWVDCILIVKFILNDVCLLITILTDWDVNQLNSSAGIHQRMENIQLSRRWRPTFSCTYFNNKSFPQRKMRTQERFLFVRKMPSYMSNQCKTTFMLQHTLSFVANISCKNIVIPVNWVHFFLLRRKKSSYFIENIFFSSFTLYLL